MNYELAKQLKDAGFPQTGVGRQILPQDAPTHVYTPTLEELTAACVALSKNGDFHLEAMDGKWSAATCWLVEPYAWHDAETPTEAVARLWLALNPQRYAGHEAHPGKN